MKIKQTEIVHADKFKFPNVDGAGNFTEEDSLVLLATENLRLRKDRYALLEAATSALDIFPHLIKFLKFQKPGKEFWPNREAGEAAIVKLESAIAQAEARP